MCDERKVNLVINRKKSKRVQQNFKGLGEIV